MRRTPLLLFTLAGLLGWPASGGAIDPDRPVRAEELVEPYQIADARVQLEGDGSNLEAYQDVDRFVESLGSCGGRLGKGVRAWLSRLSLVASKTEVEPHRLRVVVEVDKPAKGAVLVLYRNVPEQRIASLEILFDAIGRLEPLQKQQLVGALELVELKMDLKERMNCRP